MHTKYIQELTLDGSRYSTTRNGSVHKSSIIATIVRSPIDSDTRVMMNMVIIPNACDGIVNRLVWNVLNLNWGFSE